MDRFRNRFSFCVKAICTVVLTLLGFDSSSEIRLMYGMPVGNFEIKGSVSTADSNEAVKDAQIKAKYDNEANQTVISIARSDSAGNFTLAGKAVSDRLQIICTPADSLLRPDTITVNLTYRPEEPIPAVSGNVDSVSKKRPLSPPAPKTFRGHRGKSEKTVDFKLRPQK